MQKKKKPLVTQTAGQRQIRDPLLTLFLPCLPVSLSLSILFMFCSSLFLGYFFFFPSNFSFASYAEEEEETPSRNEFPCSIANSQCLCPLSLCLQVVGGGRTNVAEHHKQNKGSLSLLSCASPRDKGVSSRFCDARLLLVAWINKNNSLTSTFSCHPPPPAGQPAPMSFSPIHPRLSWNFPCAALQSSPWFLLPWVPPLAGLLPQISREPTKLLLQRPPLLLGLAQAKRQGSAAHHAAATSARSFITPLQSRYWAGPGLRREHHLRPIQEQCDDVIDMHEEESHH